jgi:hemerythrin-like metal-binding protein
VALFAWDDIYVVGVESIDEQHRTLFDIANRFHDSWAQGCDRGTLRSIFAELVDYTVYHFAEEERQMSDMRYPDLTRHRGYHTKLADLVKSYTALLENGPEGVEQRIMEFLRLWLNAHVLGTDKQIGQFLAAR